MANEGTRDVVQGLGKYLVPESLSQLLSLTFRPAEHNVRTLEYVDLSGDLVVRRTVREFQGLVGPVLIPVAFPRRGDLTDTIRLEDPAKAGSRLHILPELQTFAVVRLILAAVAEAAAFEDNDIQAAALALSNFVPSADARRALQRIDQFRSVLPRRAPVEAISPSQASFLNALQLFARRRPLLVPCEVPEDLPFYGIGYERDVANVDIRRRGVREGTRELLGRAPDHVRLDAPLATRCVSYHIRCRLPADYFVRDLQCRRRLRTPFRRTANEVWTEYAALNAPPTWILGEGANPTEIAHIQVRDMGQLSEARLGLVILLQLAERPLGRLGAALMRLSIALLTVLLLVIFGKDLIVGNLATVTAAIFGLPALLGASLIAIRSTPTVRDSVVARAGTGVAVTCGLAVSLVLLAWSLAESDYVARHHDAHISSFGAPGGVKIALALVGFLLGVTLIDVSVALLRNIRRYRRALKVYRKAEDPAVTGVLRQWGRIVRTHFRRALSGGEDGH